MTDMLRVAKMGVKKHAYPPPTIKQDWTELTAVRVIAR